jgi:hypothetical protein
MQIYLAGRIPPQNIHPVIGIIVCEEITGTCYPAAARRRAHSEINAQAFGCLVRVVCYNCRYRFLVCFTEGAIIMQTVIFLGIVFVGAMIMGGVALYMAHRSKD